jgi:hypothetical protein
VKNSRSKSREDLPDLERRRKRWKRMNSLWTRLWMSLKRRSFTSILNRSLENTKRSRKSLKKRSSLSSRKKKLQFKLKFPRKRRKSPRNDDLKTQFKYSTFIISNIIVFIPSHVRQNAQYFEEKL